MEFSDEQDPYTRDDFKTEIEEAITRLEKANDVAQEAVSFHLARASGLFFSRFGTMDEFMMASEEVKMGYIEELNRREDEYAETDRFASYAFALFKMWVGTVIECDRELMVLFVERLGPFMNRGEKLILELLDEEENENTH